MRFYNRKKTKRGDFYSFSNAQNINNYILPNSCISCIFSVFCKISIECNYFVIKLLSFIFKLFKSHIYTPKIRSLMTGYLCFAIPFSSLLFLSPVSQHTGKMNSSGGKSHCSLSLFVYLCTSNRRKRLMCLKTVIYDDRGGG